MRWRKRCGEGAGRRLLLNRGRREPRPDPRWVEVGCSRAAAGVHFGEHTCVVALGIGINGVKHRSEQFIPENTVGKTDRTTDGTNQVMVA